MNTKHNLIILFFFTLFILNFTAKSQNSSELIKVKEKTFGYAYYQNNKVLKFGELLEITKGNPTAYNHIVKASRLDVASVLLGTVGGGFLGFSLGYGIGCFITGQTINIKIFLPTLLIGIASSGCGIIFRVQSTDNTKRGVEIYNNAIKQKNSESIDLGFTANGVIMRVKF